MKRTALYAAGFALLAIAGPALAQTKVDVWSHAFNIEHDPKYPEGFANYDYVNVDAPKGGTVRLSSSGGFDSFNPILPKGDVATGLGLLFESLLTPPMDETGSYYGLLAEALKIAPDYGSVTFRLNPKAKWHDGAPITADDVVWSFEKTIELSPNMAQYYANVTKAEVSASGEVTFTFDQTGNKELPLIIGQFSVLPKHWWEGTDAKGKKRDIIKTTLEAPLGSGPYRLASFDPGRTITYERVPDAWSIDHPTHIGQNNFDTYKIEFFKDETVNFEAFKADQFDWWREYSARRWATSFDFPAVKDGRVVLEEFKEDRAGSGQMTGFVFNQRREKFQDTRLREALNYAFDFETLKQTVFFGQYERIDSYFFGLSFRSSGLPEGEELEILNTVKDSVPESVFTKPYTNPVSGDAGKLRANLREAMKLLTEAGYKLEGTKLVDATGQQLSLEILSFQNSLEPVFQNLVTNLGQIGIEASIRFVDTAQYINRLRSFDYDVIYASWAQSNSPGNEQRFFFGSSTADQEGGQNYAGLKDPAVDALIEKLIVADDRETQEAVTKALDRVLLHKYLVIPGYGSLTERYARWDRFSRPEKLPEFSSGFPTIWWWDADKAAKAGGANQ
jgi:microcin C transport system substrate-binding protein